MEITSTKQLLKAFRKGRVIKLNVIVGGNERTIRGVVHQLKITDFDEKSMEGTISDINDDSKLVNFSSIKYYP